MSAAGFAVVGKCFGDEGKGLAVDWLCRGHAHALAVRHNGGAQSGHTVELPDGKRFVFHELSSGSFRGADTFWADSFIPDLFKLEEELDAFRAVAGSIPTVFAHARAGASCVDDVLVNMALEARRGRDRHGSCGMGINEAELRAKAGFALEIGALCGAGATAIRARLARLRREYLPGRLAALGLVPEDLGEYGELLTDANVLVNAAEAMARGADRIVPVEDGRAALQGREAVVFEGGQGLLLDAQYKAFAPHLTASRTGLTEPARIASNMGIPLAEVIYVSRSYVTRHGAGPLPLECPRQALGAIQADATNVDNPWQGSLRYARHPSPEAFCAPVRRDLAAVGIDPGADPGRRPRIALLVTHLNETGGQLLLEDRSATVDQLAALPGIAGLFDRVYAASSRYARDIQAFEV